jgi:hypothetical protein
MGIEETTETWIRVEVLCDGLGDDRTCPVSAGDELERIFDIAPTVEGARKAILNAAVKAGWRRDPELQRWLCPECRRAYDAAEQPEDVGVIEAPPSAPKMADVLLEAFF